MTIILRYIYNINTISIQFINTHETLMLVVIANGQYPDKFTGLPGLYWQLQFGRCWEARRLMTISKVSSGKANFFIRLRSKVIAVRIWLDSSLGSARNTVL
jgi:hypothetical protein